MMCCLRRILREDARRYDAYDDGSESGGVEKTFREVMRKAMIFCISPFFRLKRSYNVTAMVGQQLSEEFPDTKIM